MAAFATHTDLAARLGIDLAEGEQGRADTLLTLASDLIRRAARQDIDQGTTTFKVSGGIGRILFPQRPVVSVASVTVDGATLDGWTIDGDYLTGTWSGRELEITYTHGWNPVPDAIKAVCLEIVTRAWVNPGAVSQEGYGSERTSYPAVGMTLTVDERKTIRDVVRRGSQAVDIR